MSVVSETEATEKTTAGIHKKKDAAQLAVGVSAETIQQPHDKAFKAAMSDIRVATEMIETYLPMHVTKLLDLRTLGKCNGSYIDRTYRDTQSDMLYSVKTKQGDDCYLYFLWEHQSSYDKTMHVRILSYMCRIMEEHINQGHDHLPLVIPSLVYNGKQSPYPGTCDLFDEFSDSSLARELMFKPFTLVDLTSKSNEELLRSNWSGLLKMLLKHMRERDFLHMIEQLKQSFVYLYAHDGKTLAENMLECILRCTNISDDHKLIEMVKEAVPEAGEDLMTVYEKWTNEGIQKGIQKGMDLGRQEGIDAGRNLEKENLIRNMLVEKMGVSRIAQLVKADINEVEAVKERLLSEEIKR